MDHLSFTLQHTALLSLLSPARTAPVNPLSGDLQTSAFGIPQPSATPGETEPTWETPLKLLSLFPLPASRALLLQASNILLSDLTGNWEEAQRILIETEMGFLNEKHQQKPESNVQRPWGQRASSACTEDRGKVAHEDLQVQGYLR